MSENFVTIAKISKTRGLRGEVVADILTDFPERFEILDKVFIVKPNGETLEAGLENFWFQKGRVILKFENFDKIENAETLKTVKFASPKTKP